MNRRGKLYVISGPSGVGKSTLLDRLFPLLDDYWFSVSSTTRAPREGETAGVDYNYISEDEFVSGLENGHFLEHNRYSTGDYYGTPAGPIEEKLDAGVDVFLDIDTNGFRQVKEKMPEAVSVFILPKSLDTLRQRLVNRGTESSEKIEQRLSLAQREIDRAEEYDFRVINDDLDKAVDDLYSIIADKR